MPYRLNGKSYPYSVSDLLAHPQLGGPFRAFIDEQFCSENYQFIDDLAAGARTEKLYNTYLLTGANRQLGFIGGDRKEDLDDLAANFADPEWPTELNSAKHMALRELGAHLSPFYDRSKQYKDFCFAQLDPRKVAKRLGMRQNGPREHILLVAQTILAAARDEDRVAINAARALIDAAELDAKPDRLVKGLRNGGTLLASSGTGSKPADADDAITFNKRQEKLLGLDNPNAKKLKELLGQMALAHAAKEMPRAKQIFKEIRKLEPSLKRKGISFFGTSSYDQVISGLRKAKVLG